MSSSQRHRAAVGRVLLPAVFLSALSFPALAVQPLDTFSIRVAGYISKFDTQLRADGETVRGSDVDLDRDLGLDGDSTIGLISASWRPFEDHEFGISYYQDSFDSRRTLNRDINFDGATYPASATVRSEYNLDAYELNYNWWAANNETWALGPRLGLIWYKVELDLSLVVDAGGNQGGADFDRQVSADIPAPTIGGSWRWTPAEDWRLYAEAGYFKANINDIDADVTFARGGVEWYPWESFGFMLDYTYNNIDADADANRFNGHLEFKDSGIRLGGVYRF
ncbi:hypothetical protein AB4Y64_08855 [Lysobacter sp. TAF61]|uniref:hypothetical protein n=1 Tax=Lysobacter sp. TAF61 TaxID=3233072 RepID=UPI003F9E09D4